jgi:hypothetical protein
MLTPGPDRLDQALSLELPLYEAQAQHSSCERQGSEPETVNLGCRGGRGPSVRALSTGREFTENADQMCGK